MPWYDFVWNYEPGGNVGHIEEHGLTPEDVEEAICNPLGKKVSRSSGTSNDHWIYARRPPHCGGLRNIG